MHTLRGVKHAEHDVEAYTVKSVLYHEKELSVSSATEPEGITR